MERSTPGSCCRAQIERQTQLSVIGIADDTGEQKKQKMKKGLTRHSGTQATVGYTPVQLTPCRFFDATVKIEARKKSREGRTNDPHNSVSYDKDPGLS